uniref:Uncharacterized protein n=1 Tax=Lepeophtheirus salmonis TaxID=72036 RepID=A0A0K2V542_LEPSM
MSFWSSWNQFSIFIPCDVGLRYSICFTVECNWFILRDSHRCWLFCDLRRSILS